MHSVKLARSYVQDVLVNRAQSRECIIIATRKVREWNLPKHENILIYGKNESRGAFLTPNSKGGDAIRTFLTNERYDI